MFYYLHKIYFVVVTKPPNEIPANNVIFTILRHLFLNIYSCIRVEFHIKTKSPVTFLVILLQP